MNRPVVRAFSAPLYSNREIKHYDTLLIGDICSKNVLQDHITFNTLSLTCPNRNLEASYQILLHTESILGEGGKCVIVDGKKEMKNPITLFDVGFLSQLRKKELNVECLEKKRNFPLFYAPLRSLKLLLGIGTSAYKKSVCPHKGIVDFCNKKQLQLTYLVKY